MSDASRCAFPRAIVRDVYKRQIIIVLHVYILPLIIYVFAKLVTPALTFLLRPAVHGGAGPVNCGL